MIHDPANALAAISRSDAKLRGLLGGMSVFTMIMTVPQVLAQVTVDRCLACFCLALCASRYLTSKFAAKSHGTLRKRTQIASNSGRLGRSS
jgi:hypothetical protein